MKSSRRHYQRAEPKKIPLRAPSIHDCTRSEIFAAWGHARFGFFVKNFLTEKEK
jgi:hypothetical protein